MHAAAISSHLLSELQWRQETTQERLPIGALEGLIEGCPRGRITEIVGPVSSGRTTLLHSILCEATRLQEYCAVIDAMNAFDPASADRAGVDLSLLVWIRCGGNAEHAIQAADLLVHSGGFGVIALDLCDVPTAMLRRFPMSWWYRFRRAIENTPAVLVILENEPTVKSCASLLLETKREQAEFTGQRPFQVLDKAGFEVLSRKPPMHPGPLRFEARVLR